MCICVCTHLGGYEGIFVIVCKCVFVRVCVCVCVCLCLCVCVMFHIDVAVFCSIKNS